MAPPVAGFQKISLPASCVCVRWASMAAQARSLQLDIAHQIRLGTALRLASHHGPLHAYRALPEIDVRPAQCNLFGRPEAGEERGREVVDDLRVFPLSQALDNRFDLGQGEGMGRGSLHRPVLDRGGRIVVDCAVASCELEHST